MHLTLGVKSKFIILTQIEHKIKSFIKVINFATCFLISLSVSSFGKANENITKFGMYFDDDQKWVTTSRIIGNIIC